MATWPTIQDDDGSGTTGTILDNALFGQVRDYIGASWNDVTFSAGNFTASGAMTWTLTSPDQVAYRWIEIGKTMHLSVYLQQTTVAGTLGSNLRVAVPNGRTIVGTTAGACAGTNNGTAFSGVWEAVNGLTYVAIYLDANFSTWAASTNNTAIRMMATFEIS